MTHHLRRLPWTEAGKDAYVTPGDGIINRMADAAENMSLAQAEDLARQATRAARDPQASAQELRLLMRLLGAITQDAVNVAKLRGERLGMDNEDGEDPVDEPLYGQRPR